MLKSLEKIIWLYSLLSNFKRIVSSFCEVFSCSDSVIELYILTNKYISSSILTCNTNYATIVIRNFLCNGCCFTAKTSFKNTISHAKKIFAHSIRLSMFVGFPWWNEFLEQKEDHWEQVLI